MSTQPLILQVFLSGAWTNVPLYSAAGASYQYGAPAYTTSWPTPTELTAEINNDTYAWDPARPESAIYGLVGRNTPARMVMSATIVAYGEATVWAPDRTPEHQPGAQHGRSWVTFVAYGQLQRIQDWTDPGRSPMYRTIAARATSIGHWPLEDARYARTLANTLAAGPAGTIKGTPELASSERPFGASQSVKLSADTQLSGRFVASSTTAGWQISFSFKADALPAAATYGRILRWTTSNGYTWLVEFTDTSWRWSCTDIDGVVLQTSNISYSGFVPTSWVTMRFKVSQSGAAVVVEPAWYVQGATTPVGTTDGFAVGTVGALRSWFHDGNTNADGCWLGHIFAVTGVADDLQSSDALMVFNGYQGERVLARYQRTVADLGLGTAWFTAAITPYTHQMGPQPIASGVKILEDLVRTDGGTIIDEPVTAGIFFTTRRFSYARTPDATFTYPGHIAPPFRRLTGSETITNVLTVVNGDRGEVTVSRTTGPNSTAAPPAGVSEKRGSIDVNLYLDSDVADRANWELARLATEGPRYNEFTVDLLANPGLAATMQALRPGHRVQITGYPPDTIDLLVTGVKSQIGAVTRTVTVLVEPYEVYKVGVYDAADWRWDTATTTLAAGATSTATALSLTCTSRDDILSTTSLPYGLLVGGEVVTATAMTAAAGAGPYTQTATVTRSVNGVVKAQTAGTQVTVADYKRWGL